MKTNVCLKEKNKENVFVPTAKGSQQDLLVKWHWALAFTARHVPHCLIDGKPGEGVGHLKRDESKLCI